MKDRRAILEVQPATVPLVAPQAIIAIVVTLRETVADRVYHLGNKKWCFPEEAFKQGGVLLFAYRLVLS